MAVNLDENTIERLIKVSYQSREPFGNNHYSSQARCAAVLLLLVRDNGRWHLLLTRRTETVQDHKGQVSFPGGACEPQDDSLESTALREAFEEIGVRPEDVRLFGRLQPYLTVSHYLVTPVVGTLPWPYPIIPYPQEVSRVFTIPLDWLADPRNHEVRLYSRSGDMEPRPVIFFRPYDGEMLWGVSAAITVIFLNALQLWPTQETVY